MDFENENKDQLNEQQSASRDGYQSDFRPAGRSPRPRISHSGPRPQGYDRSNSYNRYQQRDDEGAFRPEGFGSSLQQQPREQRPESAADKGEYQNVTQQHYRLSQEPCSRQ